MPSGFFNEILNMIKNPTIDISNLKGIILDMDGVLWRGTDPIGNLPEIFGAIDGFGLRVVMATNNATSSPQQFVKKLEEYGVIVESWQVITSGMATAYNLKGQFPDGGDVFVVGEQALIDIMANEGFNHGGENPIAVVAALDRTITYEKLTEATLLIRRGVPFFGTNPDLSYPIPEGEAPGAGAILAALEATTGVSPTIIGKPKPILYEVALERLGTSPQSTLVVGDRLETDILSAQDGGFPCALVLSGVTTLNSAKKWRPPPDFITANLTSLLESIRLGKSTKR
jgi:4-nitrophenyl phosphatase